MRKKKVCIFNRNKIELYRLDAKTKYTEDHFLRINRLFLSVKAETDNFRNQARF